MKRISAIILMILMCRILSAQNTRVLNGTVVDSGGSPVIGAVIIPDNNPSWAAQSDVDGTFSVKIANEEGQSLTVMCLGYLDQQITVSAENDIVITLSEDAISLEESVVIGYGSMKKSDLTGSVASVKIDEESAARMTTVDQMILGKAAGVQVQSNSAAPDAGVNIRVRGMSSFNSGQGPLYVVDGIIINGESQVTSLFTQGADAGGSDEQTNGLAGINPQDIADIQILKDASATAIYGSQGANGVVLITTKSASGDKLSVRFSAGVDVSTAYKHLDMLSFDEYVDYLGLLNQVSPDKVSYNSLMNILYEDPANQAGLKVQPMDWQDYSFRTAVSQRYFMSLSEKTGDLSYVFSLGCNSNQGIVKNSDVSQYTGRLNMERKIGTRFKIGTKSSFSYTTSNLVQGTSTSRILSSASFMRSILMTRPWRSIKGEDDDSEYVSGPDKWLNDFVGRRDMFRATPSLYFEYRILPFMTFNSTMGIDYSASEMYKYKSQNISRADGNSGAVSHTDALRFNVDNMLNFKADKGYHHLTAMLGVSVSGSMSSIHTDEGWNIVQYKSKEYSLNSASQTALSYRESQNALLSFMTRAVYNYRDRHILTGTFRYDGSSRFYGTNKWSPFPSFAYAWRINQEPWFNVPAISMAKLRIGWGMVGNQAMSDYMTQVNYANSMIGNHSSNAGYSIYIYPSNISNKDLKWETTRQYNAGFDVGLLSGRVSMSIDLYDKLTTDLLQRKKIAISNGFSTIWMNNGSILNRGLEITLDATPVAAGNFEWNIGGNISFNKNRIVSIGDAGEKGSVYVAPGREEELNYFYGSSMSSGGSALNTINIFMEGYPMGLFYAFKTDGIIQEGETGPGMAPGETYGPGQLRYVDVNRNGYIDDGDRTIVGDPNPICTFGFNTSLRYKKLSYSMTFNGSYGNKIFNLNNDREMYTSQGNYNVRRIAVVNAWTPTNTDTIYPGVGKLESADKSRFTDTNVEDGSYLRLANVSLSYSVPIKSSHLLRSMILGVSAKNVIVLTKYLGWDPDVNSYGTDITRMGIDSNSYPGARTFSFDVRLSF